MLNLSDGENELLDISIRSELTFREIVMAMDRLKEVWLVKEI